MIPNVSRRERKAARLEDLASALDAGLDPATALGVPPAQVRSGIADAMVTAGFALDIVDRRVLQAAAEAGELPAALRERAAAERFAADLVRELIGRLLYPVFVVACATVLLFWLAYSGFSGVEPLVGVGATALLVAGTVGIAWLRRRARTDPQFTTPQWARPLVADAGELRYLVALRGLYQAGVGLRQAHAVALRACDVAATRARLLRAGERVERGDPFVASLRAEGALDGETLELLDGGESTGNLEDALARASNRRRDQLERKLKLATRVAGAVVYAVAVLLVAYVVLSFYGSLPGYSRR